MLGKERLDDRRQPVESERLEVPHHQRRRRGRLCVVQTQLCLGSSDVTGKQDSHVVGWWT